MDLVAASGLLLLLALPMGLIACVVRYSMGGPVLFRQMRVGLHEKSFELAKFRTMRDAKDQSGQLLSDAKRLTGVGRFLRASSLDELPELWNIIRGDMSLVGPRPLLPEYLPFYLEDQARRHDVRPGLTGLAQVNGRNAQSWDERFELDVKYVDTLSFWGDIRILFLTVWRVLGRDGVSAEGHETMPRFDDHVRAGLSRGRVPTCGPGKEDT